MGVINDRIKNRRTDLGLTLLEVADALGVKEATAQRYESGASRPRVEATEKIAKALNVSVNEILGSDDNENRNFAQKDPQDNCKTPWREGSK